MGQAESSPFHRAHWRALLRGRRHPITYSSLEETPLDILEPILSMLSFDDLKTLSLVNKDINAYLNPRLWKHLVIIDEGVHGVDIISAARSLARDPIRAKCVESLELVWLRPFHHILTSAPKLSASIPLRLALAALPNLSALHILCFEANWRYMAKALCSQKPFLPDLPFRLTEFSCTEHLVDMIHPFLQEQSGILDLTVEPQACGGFLAPYRNKCLDICHCKITPEDLSKRDEMRSAFTCLPQGALPNLRRHSVILEYSDMEQLYMFGRVELGPKKDQLRRDLKSLPPLEFLAVEIGTRIGPKDFDQCLHPTQGWMRLEEEISIGLLVSICEDALPSLRELVVSRRPTLVEIDEERDALIMEYLVFRRVPMEELEGAKAFDSRDLLERFTTCCVPPIYDVPRFSIKKLTIPTMEGQIWGWSLEATYSLEPVDTPGQCRPWKVQHGFEPHPDLADTE